ncbi:MAG: SDR family NAD(P)-dependent oxidoreductase, partial [Gemmobacter sp.]
MIGRVVAITGASRGIGAETARIFARAGANVALLARNHEAISALAEEIGPQALAVPCDVADWRSVSEAVDRVVVAWGRLDVLINNAGIIDPIARIADADPTAWARQIEINLTGVF